jgi:hypothetical protein
MLQLGCVSANYCSKFIGKPQENIAKLKNSYSYCCDSNLCNDEKLIQGLSAAKLQFSEPEFVINNDIAPLNPRVNIVSTILYNFNLDDYGDAFNKYCINEVIFTDEDNLIVTLKKDRCNNKNTSAIDKPSSRYQPINKIIFLDKNNKKSYELLSSDTGITSVNYSKDKNLLFFISNNDVFIYKIDDNKLLTKINQIYYQDNPVDITINYNSTVLAIANKDTVLFYNISQIEKNNELIPIENVAINSFDIYRLQYAPNNDVLLVETQDKNNFNTVVYNTENLNKIEKIGTPLPLNKKENSKNIRCWYQYIPNSITGMKYQHIYRRNYYEKWIFAPSGNFIMNHKIILGCKPVSGYGRLSRQELYLAFYWHKQINQDGYYMHSGNATNLEMFSNRVKSRYRLVPVYLGKCKYTAYRRRQQTDLLAVYNAFFATKGNQVLALIATKDQKNPDNRYLFLKNISSPNIDTTYNEAIKKQQTIAIHKLFDLVHSGIFNNDSSKLAIFSDNKIQVYSINLPKNN